MQDEPHPVEILRAVAAFLRTTVVAETAAHTSFQVRVAANALDLVTRQIELAPASDVAEGARLESLLGEQGSLLDLNRLLADRIATGAIDPAAPEVRNHLWATTLAKLAIDQPNYSAYRAALDVAQPEDI